MPQKKRGDAGTKRKSLPARASSGVIISSPTRAVTNPVAREPTQVPTPGGAPCRPAGHTGGPLCVPQRHKGAGAQVTKTKERTTDSQ